MKYKQAVAGMAAGSLALGNAGCASLDLGGIVQDNSFGRYVTRPVVMYALDNFLNYLQHASENYRPSARDANYWARDAAFRNAMGEEDYNSPRYYELRPEIMESVRPGLRNPSDLVSAYLTYKDDAVARIRQRGQSEQVIKFLEKILAEKDDYANGFLARRRAEGGDTLANMWRFILNDMSQSLLLTTPR
ncbi:hypothetical protein HYT54_00010 [Candidatus Woesearchaeota archaeon]|nr:hypothetical protein [Candidatus Woesearchaeota archaeon]